MGRKLATADDSTALYGCPQPAGSAAGRQGSKQEGGKARDEGTHLGLWLLGVCWLGWLLGAGLRGSFGRRVAMRDSRTFCCCALPCLAWAVQVPADAGMVDLPGIASWLPETLHSEQRFLLIGAGLLVLLLLTGVSRVCGCSQVAPALLTFLPWNRFGAHLVRQVQGGLHTAAGAPRGRQDYPLSAGECCVCAAHSTCSTLTRTRAAEGWHLPQRYCHVPDRGRRALPAGW